MRKNLQISGISGVVCGFVSGTVVFLIYGLPAGIAAGLFSGFVTGCAIFFIVGPLHGNAVKKIVHEEPHRFLGVMHVRDMEIYLPGDESFDLCVRSAGMIKNCRVTMQDRHLGKIVARTGLNWKTWGDTIVFDVRMTGERSARIRIESRPTARSTIVDFGKNLQNISIVTSYLKEHGAILHE